MTNLLISEYPLMVLPSLAKSIGLNEAIILQQIHYWIDPRTNKNYKNDKYWVYNTYKQWQKQFPFWSEKTIKRAISFLEKQGFIISKQEGNFGKLKWYTLDYKKLSNLGSPFNQRQTKPTSGQNDPTTGTDCPTSRDKMTRQCIYNDTETTTENIISLSLPDRKTLKEEVLGKISREREMLDVWNTKIEKGKGAKHLTQARKQKLENIFRNYFNNDIKEWESFCDRITSSDFLMGKVTKFKASLDWVIKENSLVRILEGDYGITDVMDKGTTQTSYKTMTNEIEKESAPEFWKNLKKKALSKFGPSTYNSWLKKLEFHSEEQGRITTRAASKFIASQIQDNFLTTLQEMLVKENSSYCRLEIIVR